MPVHLGQNHLKWNHIPPYTRENLSLWMIWFSILYQLLKSDTMAFFWSNECHFKTHKYIYMMCHKKCFDCSVLKFSGLHSTYSVKSVINIMLQRLR